MMGSCVSVLLRQIHLIPYPTGIQRATWEIFRDIGRSRETGLGVKKFCRSHMASEQSCPCVTFR